MRHWVLVAIIAGIILGTTAVSYIVLEHFYGKRQVTTSIQTIIIENSGRQVIIDNVRYDVESATLFENVYFLGIPAAPMVGEVSVPAEAYKRAQITGGPVNVSKITITETKPIDSLPIAASIGITIGLAVLAVWVGYRQMWGDATSMLLEHGLHDMTVRDVKIVGHMMGLKEFTVPELVKLTKASKITVWRTVQKLIERGVVQPTDKTRPTASGLGGRGKPSQVYRYVGTTSE